MHSLQPRPPPTNQPIGIKALPPVGPRLVRSGAYPLPIGVRLRLPPCGAAGARSAHKGPEAEADSPLRVGSSTRTSWGFPCRPASAPDPGSRHEVERGPSSRLFPSWGGGRAARRPAGPLRSRCAASGERQDVELFFQSERCGHRTSDFLTGS